MHLEFDYLLDNKQISDTKGFRLHRRRRRLLRRLNTRSKVSFNKKSEENEKEGEKVKTPCRTAISYLETCFFHLDSFKYNYCKISTIQFCCIFEDKIRKYEF